MTALTVWNDDLSVPPPVARTVPSGSAVRFMKLRVNCIEPVGCHVGWAWFMSSVNAVFDEGPPKPLSDAEPAFMNLPGA